VVVATMVLQFNTATLQLTPTVPLTSHLDTCGWTPMGVTQDTEK
jgi:hypothetical protein